MSPPSSGLSPQKESSETPGLAQEEHEEDAEPQSYKTLPSGDHIIDLHGLPVEVSKIAVQVTIEDLLLGGGPHSTRPPVQKLGDLIIVTGVGNNSPGGIAMIRPAVIDFLKDHLGIRVLETHLDGPGRLRIPSSELWRIRGVPEPADNPWR